VAAMQVACTGRDRLKAVGVRARAERTKNMPYMFVTLDVSKLSAWLNADAYCRVERGACNAGRGAAREACGRWVAAAQSARTGRDRTQGCGSQGTRGAHLEHALHGRDLGRVEAERLVERRRGLPSRKAGMQRGERGAAREA